MNSLTSIISVFTSHDQARAVIKNVQSAGMDTTILSIVGRGDHNDCQAAGFYTSGDRIKVWGANGSFWAGVWGVLFGAAFFWVPGFGPLLVAGPFVHTLLGALGGVALVGSKSALAAALGSIGVHKNAVRQYEEDLKADKLLLIAYGAPRQVDLIGEIFDQCNAAATVAYDFV